MNIFKRFGFLLLLPIAVVIIGTVGMMAIEHLSFIDALYFTVVTITTVGYGDVTATTTGGRIFAIFLIIIGIGVFLTLLTNVVDWLVNRRQREMRNHRLHMLIGVFFTEAGNQLLRMFTEYDPDIVSFRREFIVTAQWSEKEYAQLRKKLNSYEHTVDPSRLDLDKLLRYLNAKVDLLVRQLENADLEEHTTYAELLWAVVHLHDELVARSSLTGLPDTDIVHIANDVKRAYALLTRQWLHYMLYLKDRYPFLFSLALRTNPFVENASAIVK